jgi:hypothetical protein
MNVEKRMFDFALWLIAVSLLAAILTSCTGFDPYAGLQPIAKVTSSTIVEFHHSPTRDERWDVHNLGDWRLSPTTQNGKAGH